MREVNYALYKKLPGEDLEAAESKVTEALKEQGFGVLTRIDVKGTLKQKLDVEFKPYVILGACNPHLAHQALSGDDTIGLLLPCNVVVTELGDDAEVAIIRPEAMFRTVDNPEVKPIADQAEKLLKAVLDAL
jgi:uncharacterized protein (DUF302 family)